MAGSPDPRAATTAANQASSACRDQIDRSLTATLTDSRATLAAASPASLDVLQFAGDAQKDTESKTRAIAPWAAC